MINIINFSNIEIDGINVGDCIAASTNYPDKAADILAALNAYDSQRQGQADAAALAAGIDAHTQQIVDLEVQLQSAQQTIEQLEADLSLYVIKDWPELQDDLLNAGLDDLFTLITQIAQATPNPPEDKTSLQAQSLKLIADVAAAVRAKDRIAVIDAYQAIFGTDDKAGFVQKIGALNPDRAPELVGAIRSTMPQLQAVLDSDKYKIPKNLLAFVP